MTSTHLKVVWLETQQTLRLAVPIIASQVGQLLLGVVDTIMIGRLGVVPLGASAFAVSIFSIFLVFGFGVSSCIAPFVARADGAQQKRECGEVLRHGVVFVVSFGIILAYVIQFLSKHLGWFEQPPEVLTEASGYLLIMGWSLIPALLFQSLRQFTEGLSRASFPMYVVIFAVLLNTFLNWLWIYGNWGFESQGLVGAAWATFVTRIAMFGVIAFYILRSPKFEEYLPIKWISKLRMSLMLDMFKLGFPSALQTLFEVGAFCGAAVLMGWINTTALAAHQIAISVASMTFMVTLGLSFATGIRVSNALGRKDIFAARRVGFGGIGAGGILMAFFGVVILLGQHSLPRLYIDDLNVIQIASELLVVGAFFQIFDGVQGVAVGALRGMSDVRFPTFITFAAYGLVSAPLMYLLAFTYGLGALGVWIGLSIGLVGASFALTYRFHIRTKSQIRSSLMQPELMRSLLNQQARD